MAADPPFISANADAAKVNFPGGSTGSNPFGQLQKVPLWVIFMLQLQPLDYLESTNDPRIDYFYDRNGMLAGSQRNQSWRC